MTIAIHQPNLFPWQPYFQKMRDCDLFVLLGHCQYEKNNYQSRFRADGRWFHMSVNRGMEPIRAKRYVFLEKDWNRLKANWPQLAVFDGCMSESLWQTNCAIIYKAMSLLNITTEVTTDYETHLRGTARLVDICLHHGAGKYLAGNGSRKYLDVAMFNQHDIEVIFQEEKGLDKRALVELL